MLNYSIGGKGRIEKEIQKGVNNNKSTEDSVHDFVILVKW